MASNRRFLLLFVIVVLVIVQVVVIIEWVRPKVFKYTSRSSTANFMRSLHINRENLYKTTVNNNSSNMSTSHHHDEEEKHERFSPHIINSSALSHLYHSGGPSWKPGSFCEDFLERRYHHDVRVCGDGSQISCRWNSANKHAATCDVANLIISPDKLWSSMKNVEGSFPHSKAVGLAQDRQNYCKKSTITNLADTMEGGDYVKWFVDDLISNSPVATTTCDHWINETAFLFSSQAHHIYFRFLAYYAIHKSLIDHSVEPGSYKIFRMTEGYKYLFPEFEKALFPAVQPLTEVRESRLCFRRAVLVPKCYATVLFQCKMQGNIRDKCLACNGRGLTGTALQSFRLRVLSACGIKDQPKHKSDAKLIAVILRKPYTRWKGDHPSKFQRVLRNSDELMSDLEKAFPEHIVKALHMEELDICDQIGYTHDADFLIGVHGAGLVHLWWLRHEAMAIELEPYFEMGNPSFKTLAKITGRQYQSVSIMGSSGGVKVDTKNVIEKIKQNL